MVRQEKRVVDISAHPDLLRLVREMESAGQPLSLCEEDREVAVLAPVRRRIKRPAKRRKTAADYEAFRSSAGGWAGIVDGEELKERLRAACGSSRSPVGL